MDISPENSRQLNSGGPERPMLALTLMLLWVIATLGGIGLAPLFDYDETIYAETAVEMMRNNSYLLPVANGQSFFEKPPYFYYAMDAFFALLGQNAVAARLPSVFFTLAAALYLLYIGRTLGQSRTGMNAALIYLSMLMPGLLAHAAILDAMLNFWLLVSVMSFFIWQESGKKRDAVLSMLSAGIAVGVKGPVGAIVPAMVIVLYMLIEKKAMYSARSFPWALGIPAFLMGAAPWYIAVAAAHGFGFFKEFLLVQNVGRFSKTMQGHGGGWYYYVLVLIPSTLPWIAWAPWWGAGTISRRNETGALDRLSRLGFVWTVSVLVLFTIARTKLPHYISSVYPAMAIGMAALWHLRPPTQAYGRISSWLLLIACLPVAAGLIAFPALYAQIPHILKNPKAIAVFMQDARPQWWIAVFGVVLTCSLFYAFLRIRKAQHRAILTMLVVLGIILQTTLIYSLAPFAGRLVQGPLMAIAKVVRLAPSYEPVYSLINNPSVSFYSGRSYINISKKDASERLASAREPFLLIARSRRLPGLSRVPLDVIVREGDYALLRFSPASGRRP